MLYGNIIFIKKTGGDGSKYPVTEKNIKIGRSEDCMIRIHNPQIASEHCQLIVDDNGQAKLRNLSKLTILNGKPLNQGDVTLCHGDIFKLGERLARWEYLPSSKYYPQTLSPTGRLVAVVMPRQRSKEEEATAGTSSVISVSRSTPLGGKRTYSERTVSESGSVKKVSRLSSVTKNQKTVSNVAKFVSGRHSLQAPKILFGSKAKQRKSTPGILSSKSPKPKVVQNTEKPPEMASWKINLSSPPTSGRATQRKSTPIKKSLPIKSVDKLKKSGRKNSVKTPDLKTIVESPPPKEEESLSSSSSRSTRSTSKSPTNTKEVNLKSAASALLKTPGRKSVYKAERLVNSEKKSAKRSSLKLSKSLKRSSLVLKPLDKTPVKGVVRKLYENLSKNALSRDLSQGSVKSLRNSSMNVFASNIVDNSSSMDIIETPSKGRRKSTKTSPRTSLSSSRTSTPSPNKSRKSSKESPSPSVDSDVVIIEEKTTPISKRSSSRRSKSVRSSRKSTSSSASVKKTPSPRKSLSQVKEKASPRGVRRKFSPSISSAERAAKKLKTSSPTKPDKNKKAALLVLGKANRKHMLSQNLKVLLKQKIVKKAIKQSTLPPIRKDDVAAKTLMKNVKKSKKRAVKRKKTTAKKRASTEKKSTPKVSKLIEESEVQKSSTPPLPTSSSKSQATEGGGGSRGKRISEKSSLSTGTVIQATPLKNKISIGESSYSYKSPSRQGKKSESSNSTSSISKQSTSESIPVPEDFINASKNYSFGSNRRSSKRLICKTDVSRPDFMELSPTALGLIPKNVEVFKTPKEKIRKSVSLATPKNFQATGIIKSASTSKAVNRKSLRFSSKDASFTSALSTPNTTKGSNFDFESIQTPNISVDRFVSPLINENPENFPERELSGKVATFPGGEMQRKKGTSTKIVKSPRSEPKRTKCVRKLLQSPLKKEKTGAAARGRPRLAKTKNQKSPKNDLSDVAGVRELLKTPQKTQKTVKEEKTVAGTGQGGKSTKEDLSVIEDVRKLFVMPKVQKSPKNDLSDVKGVRRLVRTPKVEKSPKNDLTDVRGVRRLLKTPREEKGPKNDLTDVAGVKRLLRTPRTQKSPKNELTDLVGVRQLLKSPRGQKSPKNELSDLRGVRQMLASPKVQKSPKNDLSDLAGVRKLMTTPRVQKSPKNDLRDVDGVEELFKSPGTEKSTKFELSVTGMGEFSRSPLKELDKYALTEIYQTTERGKKRKLSTTPRNQKSPKNELVDVSGIAKIFESPLAQRSSVNEMEEVVTKPLEHTFRSSFSDGTEVKQLLIGSGSSDITEESNRARNNYPKSRVKSFKSIRGRRTIYSTPKGPKNDLSDVEGVRELFSSYQSTSGLNLSLADLCGFFDIPNSEVELLKSQEVKKEMSRRKLKEEVEEHVIKTQKAVARKVAKETVPRATRSRKVAVRFDIEPKTKVEGKEPEVMAAESTRARGGKTIKRKAVDTNETSAPKRKASKKTEKESSVAVGKGRGTRSGRSKSETAVQSSENKTEKKTSRSKKITSVTSTASPPKLRGRPATASSSAAKKGSSKKVTTKRKVAAAVEMETLEISGDRNKISTNQKDKKTSRKVASAKVQSKTTRTVSKTSAKSTSRVQNRRSQSKSKEKQSEGANKTSPRRTRSGKAAVSIRVKKTQVQKTKTTSKKTVRSTSARKNASPAIKKSKARK